MKIFFINRNLDGKGIFKVLSKQAQLNHGQSTLMREEIMWKLFELVFAIAFFSKDAKNCEFSEIFNMALNNLSRRKEEMSAPTTPALGKTVKAITFDFHAVPEPNLEVNSLLTKSVIQIIGDILKQFTAVIP